VSAEAPKTVTLLLRAWSGGDPAAMDRLMPLLYDELRRLAARHMGRERDGHTLRATELVSEAFVRLGAEGAQATDRVHFFALAARAMRQVLVDHARRRAADKRGGGARAVTFDESLVAVERPDEIVALDEALQALAREDDRKARAVELHYFGGMSIDEVASALGVHERTVMRDLRFSEAWIRSWLEA
jgi:RNA polymerase sigma factor (TIGR02999 family)